MMYAKDFRGKAWDTLSKNYWYPFAMCFLQATVLGAITSVVSLIAGAGSVFGAMFANNFVDVMATYSYVFPLISLLSLAVSFFVGGPLQYGFMRYFLGYVDGENQNDIGILFSGFSRGYGKRVGLMALQTLYVTLWSFLFIIPGIIKLYAYRQAFYILIENPDLSASECLERSQNMMSGNKGRLFCLDFSFIGWYILSMFTFGLGSYFLAPYVQTADTIFYRHLNPKYVAEEPYYGN